MKKMHKSVRWTIEVACSEFAINPRTLSARIKQAGTRPGNDGKFSTVQIAAAVFGDIKGEKLRLCRHQANLLAIEEAEKSRQLARIEKVVSVWEQVIVALRQKILSVDKLTDDNKRDLLADLQTIPIDEYFKDSKPVEEISD